MRTAVFGGTFDPIHQGHLSIARSAADAFGLDRVLFVPAAMPPWKEPGTPYEDRLRMVALACAVDPRFEVSNLEQSSLEQRSGKNYTIHTIERLKESGGFGELYFIIGADAFADIMKWYRWQDLLREVTFIVVSRPGHRYECPPGAKVLRLDDLKLTISSSAIRATLAGGAGCEELPFAVADYIREHGLYRSPPRD